MSRKFLLATLVFSPALVAFGAGAMAQQANNREPQTLDELVDFILRPTQEAEEDEDIWDWDSEPEESLIDSPIGPPLAGPTAGDPIGPPLAGPTPEPVQEGRIRPRRVTAVDPYAATGVNLGSFIIRPSIEIGGVATDNGGGTSDKVAAVGLVVAPEVTVTSEGERYTFEAHGRGELIA